MGVKNKAIKTALETQTAVLDANYGVFNNTVIELTRNELNILLADTAGLAVSAYWTLLTAEAGKDIQ